MAQQPSGAGPDLACTPRGGRQVIPRPADAYPGAVAPWARIDPLRRRGLSLDRVRDALVSHKSPRGDVFDGFPDPGAPSAVLVALFDDGPEARVLLTRRAAHLRSHRGEVAFPGGRINPGEDPETAALREAQEEIGLDPSSVTVEGRLSELATFSSSSHITPVVGSLPARPVLELNPSEVEHAFDVTLAQLADPEIFREERWVRPGGVAPPNVLAQLGPDGSFPVWFFELQGDTVWGATARVLVELLRLVVDV